MFLGLDRGHFLSPSGQCRPFDESADGYARGEGCGVFVFKRLSDAKVENDRILAVVRAIEVNQSGCASSITHPHGETQVALFKQALAKSNISPLRVNVVEAHGTGTRAGDPTEVASIRQVFAAHRTPDNPLHLTAVKANIGHSEAASGVASLAKLVLMMHRCQIPPTISLKTLNPHIAPLSSDNTRIDTELTPWLPSHPNHSRVACLNNFGAAGSNAVIILEEYLSASTSPFAPSNIPFVFGLSAKTEVALRTLLARYLSWFNHSKFSEDLLNVAYTMTARREAHAHRICVQASNKEELVQKLESALPKHVPGPVSPAKVVFVFSGQGGQHIGMGRALYESCSFFRDQVHECDYVLTSFGFPSVLPIISPTANNYLPDVQLCEIFQPAVFILQYVLAKLWMSLGVKPAVVVGHRFVAPCSTHFLPVLTPRSQPGRVRCLCHCQRYSVTGCSLCRCTKSATDDSKVFAGAHWHVGRKDASFTRTDHPRFGHQLLRHNHLMFQRSRRLRSLRDT